jgi:hypothetical protein
MSADVSAESFASIFRDEEKAEQETSIKLLHDGFLLCLFSGLKKGATCSFKTSADFQRIIWHYIPEDINLHNHRCENSRFLFLLLYMNPADVYDIFMSCSSLLTEEFFPSLININRPPYLGLYLKLF